MSVADDEIEFVVRDGTPTPEESVLLRLDVLTARAVCELPDPPESAQLLGPLLVRGQRTVLGAHTGEGKTTLILQLIRAAVEGEELFEWTGVGGVRALVVDLEQGLRTVKRRLWEARLGTSELVDYVRVPDGLALDQLPDHRDELERVIVAGAYDLVCIDPLYKAHAGDSNEERQAVDLMRILDGWRETYGFALLLASHCRKPPPNAKAPLTIHDLFGSGAYVRGAEVVLGLERLRDGYSQLHFLKDRDGDLPIGARWGLLFDRENGYRRDPNDGSRKPTAVDQVRELLEQQPGELGIKELMETTGKAERTIEDALKKLEAISVRPGGEGGRGTHVYTLPASPERSRSAAEQEELEWP